MKPDPLIPGKTSPQNHRPEDQWMRIIESTITFSTGSEYRAKHPLLSICDSGVGINVQGFKGLRVQGFKKTALEPLNP
jgi:hypothetical protein